MQFIFVLRRSIMVHRLSSLNSCFEANQGWYVFNLSFHYETVSLPRSLQVRKLCLPTQEIPLQQLPQKGNFPQKWAQLMPLSRAVWRGSGMRAPRTPLPAYSSQHWDLQLCPRTEDPTAPSCPLPRDSQESSEGTRRWFFTREKYLERGTGHTELQKSRGRGGGAAEQLCKLF